LRYDQFSQKLRYKGRTEEAQVVGITEGFEAAFPLEVQWGRFFRPEELNRGALVGVVGSRLMQDLVGSDKEVGVVLWYGGYPIQVIGVLKAQGAFGGDLDNALLVPFGVQYRIHGLFRYSIQGDRTLLVRAKDPEALPIDLLETRVRGLMRQARHLPPQAEDNFAINRQDALLDQVRDIAEYVQMVGLFIAGFSLLVGGFGVANILYIAVRERRGEIGIQRAMGAPRGFILGLFLVEGLFLTLVGGFLGLSMMALLMVSLSGWAAQEGLVVAVAVGDLVWSLVITLLVGLLAGMAPAWSAARLHPIEAIRTAA
jgi:putative ABC transport system permease protein